MAEKTKSTAELLAPSRAGEASGAPVGSASSGARAPGSAQALAAQDPADPVYAALGALLGTLEVIATDGQHPLPPVQGDRLRGARRFVQHLQYYLEALLTLAADDLRERLRRTPRALRPLLEHAVRGALRSFEAQGVELQMPEGSWGELRVSIDASRVDMAIRAMVETLVLRVGRGGAVRLALSYGPEAVSIELIGSAGAGPAEEPSLFASSLLERAWRRLFELHGGSFELDPAGLAVRMRLPTAGAP